MNVRALVLLCAVLAATAAVAHDTNDAVVFTLVDARMPTIWDGLHATARFHAAPEADLIYRVTPRVPPELQAGREPARSASFADLGDEPEANVSIDLPPLTDGRWSLSTLFYDSSEIRVPVRVEYAVRAEVPRTIDAFVIVVTPRAPLPGILLGGVLGVLTMLLFTFLNDFRMEERKKIFSRDYFLGIAIRFGLGVCVTSVVILIILYMPKTFEKLPVTVELKHWVGGFVVGFFFQQLAHYIAGKLKPPKETAAAAQPA
jgi:hypothetical protein